MERTILKDLQGWKGSRYRKPLYLQGVNRSGKTWVLKEFGEHYYKNTVYISLREQEEYKQFFQKKEIFKTEDDYGKRILQSLMLSCGQRILPCTPASTAAWTRSCASCDCATRASPGT